jgi:hypothetical protein
VVHAGLLCSRAAAFVGSMGPKPRCAGILVSYVWRNAEMPLCGKRIGLVEGLIGGRHEGISRVQLSHVAPVRTARFDEPSLVSAAGLVPAVALAQRAGLKRACRSASDGAGRAGSAASSVPS